MNNAVNKILKLKDVTFVNLNQDNWNVAVKILIILVVIFVICILVRSFAAICIKTIRAVIIVKLIQVLNYVALKKKIILHAIHVK